MEELPACEAQAFTCSNQSADKDECQTREALYVHLDVLCTDSLFHRLQTAHVVREGNTVHVHVHG